LERTISASSAEAVAAGLNFVDQFRRPLLSGCYPVAVNHAPIGLDRLASADVSRRRPKGLIEEAWRIVDQLGWAKTYDAEYLALARLLRSRPLTTDAKLKASGSDFVEVIGPADLF